MAVLDNVAAPFKMAITSITISDGGILTCTVPLMNSYVTWSQPGRSYVGVKDRGRHQSTPVTVETEDGVCAVTFSLYNTTYLGDSNTHIYEVATFSGNASAWASVGVGSKKQVSIAVTENSTVDGGGSQVITFGNCVFTGIDAGDSDGLRQLTIAVEHQGNAPTIA